jgi:hypothetical protein
MLMIACGLLHLHQKYPLSVPKPSTRSFIHRGAPKKEQVGPVLTQCFGLPYDPGADDRSHLEFALKWETLDLRVLAAYFRRPEAGAQVTALVDEKPTGEYARRLWYLFEWLTGEVLPIPDGAPRNYLSLLDPDDYVVTATPLRSKRHHVDNNIAGTSMLCPLVRRTSEVDALIALDFRAEIERLVPSADLDLLYRAISYLYLKETRSSFAIEGETLPVDRDTRFVAQLEEVAKASAVDKADLIRWQQVLVDPRYSATAYRTDQVYVAEGSRIGRRPHIHYIAPKPEDVERLMASFFDFDAALSDAPPLVHAALWSFVFVFIHPFDDGNGRLHRLLLHNVLRRRGLTPPEIVLPVSAVIVADRSQYDAVLETFSRPLMEALEGHYSIDEQEVLSVNVDSVDLYRSFDATPMIEAVGRWMRRAIEHDLVDEIAWLRRYDRTRDAVRKIVDMPDKRLRIFVAIVEENGGRLSARKRAQFAELTDNEIQQMESAVQEHLLQRLPESPNGRG